MSTLSERAEVDLIVIGGGVNGTGVARDAALRGLRVALFEKNDIGFGASGNSSGMIHGGPRYLTHNPEVTYASCLDSGHIQKIAPHMLFRVPFLMPAYGSGAKAWAELSTYDAFFQVYDRYQSLKRSKTHLRFTSDEVRELEPGLVPTAGAISFDEWGLDGVRLCIANTLDAFERGAHIFPRTEVHSLLRDPGGAMIGVGYRDLLGGGSGTLRARLVVNATGAWATETARGLGIVGNQPLVRPGKGIHVFLDRRLSNFAIVTQAIDGRQVFLLPWQNMSVLGTTDTDYYGDLNDVVANTDEVRYLVEAIAKVFPAVEKARAIGTWGGVRPTLYEWGKPADALSREHEILDHSSDGTPGLYSMVGGKLASYRLFAEEMIDLVVSRLGVAARCQTATLALPGGEEPSGEEELIDGYGVDRLSARRLHARHGSRALRVLEEGRACSTSLDVVCPCEPVTEAEVRYVVKREWAASVSDIARRTRLGLGPCGGLLCAARAGRILADELGASETTGLESAKDFLNEGVRRRAAIQGPEQARVEAALRERLKAEIGWIPPLGSD